MNTVLWSKGPYNDIYNKKQTGFVEEENNIIEHMKKYNGKILWIRIGYVESLSYSDLDIVANNLQYITKPTLLLTSDGDRCVPSGYDMNTVKKIFECKNIVKWHTQNYDKTIDHEKLKYFPIGFDFHTNHDIENELVFMLHSALKLKEKNETHVFFDSHVNISNISRIHIFQMFIDNPNFKFIKNRMPFTSITNIYNQFLFVISPEGNGLDCHRTWELFLAGCIVIKKSGPLDNMFIENDLPVVIIDDLDTLNDDLPNKLKQWKEQFIEFTDIRHIYERLRFEYWLK